MPTQGGSSQSSTKARRDAMDGYSDAVKFAIESAKSVWDVFRCMLSANSFIVILIGAIKHSFPNLASLSTVLGVFGILLCIAWVLLTRRIADYNRYYYAAARYLESAAFGPLVRTVRDGASYANGSEVQVDGKAVQMRWGSKLFRVETLVYVVISSFVVIYAFLLAQT